MLKQETNHTYSHALSIKADGKSASEIEASIQEQLKALEEEARMQLPPPSPRFEKDEAVVAEYTDVKSARDE